MKNETFLNFRPAALETFVTKGDVQRQFVKKLGFVVKYTHNVNEGKSSIIFV